MSCGPALESGRRQKVLSSEGEATLPSSFKEDRHVAERDRAPRTARIFGTLPVCDPRPVNTDDRRYGGIATEFCDDACSRFHGPNCSDSRYVWQGGVAIMDRGPVLPPRYNRKMLSEWLHTALSQSGRSQADIARMLTTKLGRSIDRAAVNKMIKGTRKIAADELLAISGYLEAAAPTPVLEPTRDIPPGRPAYGGKVSAGYFLALDEFNQDLEHFQVPPSIPRHPGYPNLKQTAYLALGDSMNEAGIVEGMWVVAASYADWIDKIGELDNGNYVIVQRSRASGSELERTVKEVQFARRGMRLIPRSSNPVHKALFIDLDTDADPDTEEVSIIGVVLWFGSDVDPRSRK